MCGIYGMVRLDGAPLARPEAAARMAAALRHRGPDGQGDRTWTDARLGVTRLRVIDLHERADQPFSDPTGDVVLACNGEIYNAPDLRRRYADFPFRSASDVEVILPLYLERGAAGLADLDGMFALALLDRRTGTLVLARDRAGEKPLFTARRGPEVWFASEMGALLADGSLPRRLDPPAAHAFLRDGYVREPATCLAGIEKVPAGTIVTMHRSGTAHTRYWDPMGGVPHATPDLRAALRAAVGRQVRADVPVGVFTSGGLDSSLLAALAVETLGAARVRTFAVGFDDPSYDERRYADRFARTLGTAHRAVTVQDEDIVPALDAMTATGEPVGDPAAVPTWCLARAARAHVTVVLSGEGADELFGGYPTYVGHRLAPAWQRLPAPVRSILARAVGALPASQRRVPLEFLLKRFVRAADAAWDERHGTWSANGLPEPPLRAGPWSAGPVAPAVPGDVVAAAMRLDYEGPLRERLLVKVDRATMAVALEARAPFLDPAVTRAAFAAGGSHVRGFRTKCVLREVARPLLPRFILHRRKRGLSVPLGRWLNGPLAGAADGLPGAAERLQAAGLVDAAGVAAMLAAHRAGTADHGRALWTLLVLDHWLQSWNVETTR